MSLRRNIEFKARLTNLPAARAIADETATEHLGIELQTDTYFHVRQGRLKLREITGRGAWLIGYERGNTTSTRGSDYRLVEIRDSTALKETLATALGILVTVSKSREIFLYQNVRIHLDEVQGLGEFLEFEAVIGENDDDAGGHRLLDELRARFASALGDPVGGSYSDLLIEHAR